jgi:hypothetical protein
MVKFFHGSFSNNSLDSLITGHLLFSVCEDDLFPFLKFAYYYFLGDFILKINAVDTDASPNGELQYRILPGPDSHLFDLGLRSGALSLAEDLSLRDAERTLTLPYEVSDLGTPQLSTKSSLSLSPADRALFPVFAGTPETIVVRENDLTGGGNAWPKFEANGLGQKEVNYRLAAGNWADSFQVEEKTGQLRLLKALDHEKVNLKHFIVTVF